MCLFSGVAQAILEILHHDPLQTNQSVQKRKMELQYWSRRTHYRLVSPLAEVLHASRYTKYQFRRRVSRRLVLAGAIAKWQFCLQVLLICGEAAVDQELEEQHTQFTNRIDSKQMDTIAIVQTARSESTAQKGSNTFCAGHNEGHSIAVHSFGIGGLRALAQKHQGKEDEKGGGLWRQVQAAKDAVLPRRSQQASQTTSIHHSVSSVHDARWCRFKIIRQVCPVHQRH